MEEQLAGTLYAIRLLLASAATEYAAVSAAIMPITVVGVISVVVHAWNRLHSNIALEKQASFCRKPTSH